MIVNGALKKLGRFLRAAYEQVARSRTGAAVLSGLRTTGISIGKVLHQLWLEVTGFTFLAIAGIGAIAGFREYGKYHAGLEAGPERLILAVVFTISFAWFGVTSFFRIRGRGKA